MDFPLEWSRHHSENKEMKIDILSSYVSRRLGKAPMFPVNPSGLIDITLAKPQLKTSICHWKSERERTEEKWKNINHYMAAFGPKIMTDDDNFLKLGQLLGQHKRSNGGNGKPEVL